MSLPTGDVIGILADNLRLRRSVLPISGRNATRWARGLDLHSGGETVLYTGMMYQLIPYIEGLVSAVTRLGDSPLARFTPLGRRINRLVNISAFMVRPPARVKAEYDQVPRDVARLLQQAGVEFGYLYKDDLYSGALAYDLGADEVVTEHARRVHEVLKRRGVKMLITIDPHTTNMMRSVYPILIPGYDIQVKSYLEVLVERGFGAAGQGVTAEESVEASKKLAGEVVIHDPCVFARYEGILDEPRALLAATGLTVKEPEKSGKMTWCCGGPVEALYPEKARANAEKRAGQLTDVCSDVVTMCPMCFVNLSTAAPEGVAFHDISHYLARAFVS
ncbi:MAG: (Fe-S)-binding protein [Thermoleophilia bacterium]|nr:(Fe-S)-binding protein [Thermoleophilia bacterium]